MPLVNQLAANPIGGSGIAGMPQQQNPNDVLNLVNRLKDREMMDFQNKANFMADLTLRQEQRRRNMEEGYARMGSNTPTMDPSTMEENPGGRMLGQMDPMGAMPLKDKLDFNLKQQELAQKGKLGQEALDVKTAQEKLNQQKSDQIHQQKIDELTTKQNEYKQKMDLAHQQLQDKNTNLKNQLALHKTIAENLKAYHDAEMSKKDLDRQRLQDNFEKTYAQHQEAIDNARNVQTTTEVDPSGNKKTVTTKRGSAAETVDVQGKDGKMYVIPKEKLNDMDSDGTPHWKQVGGGDQQPQSEDNNDAS